MVPGRFKGTQIKVPLGAAPRHMSRRHLVKDQKENADPETKEGRLTALLKQFTLPGLIAALWGTSIYVYDNVWKSYFIAEQLSISTKSSTTPLCSGLMGVQIDLTITNNGSDPIFQALNGITVYGFKITKKTPIEEDDFGKSVVAAINADNSIRTYFRHADISVPQLISFASFLTPAYEFEPKQTITLQKFFAVPQELDYLEVSIEILHTTKPLHAKPKYSYREEKRIGMDLSSPSIQNLRRSSTNAAIPLTTEKNSEGRFKQDCASNRVQAAARQR